MGGNLDEFIYRVNSPITKLKRMRISTRVCIEQKGIYWEYVFVQVKIRMITYLIMWATVFKAFSVCLWFQDVLYFNKFLEIVAQKSEWNV